MEHKETIATQSGWALLVETRVGTGRLEVVFKSPAAKPCVLHWGLRHAAEQADWGLPPQSSWPPETRMAGKNAVESPFRKQNGGAQLVISLDRPPGFASLDFVLYFPEEKRWDNNQRRNYRIPLAEPPANPPAERAPAEQAPGAAPPLERLHAQLGGRQSAFERAFMVQGRGQLAVVVSKGDDRHRVSLLSDIPGDLVLHWGIARRSPLEWLTPPESMRSADTVLWQGHTAQTPFVKQDGLNSLNIEFSESDAPLGIQFVLKQAGDGGSWIDFRGGNFYVPVHIPLPQPASPGMAQFQELADEIIRSEMDRNSWTLMHRFNLCHDLLDRVGHDPEGLSLLFVWLRFSAVRQLTWQRNYNTKPRELAHAQDRLTQKLAGIYKLEPASRSLIRMMLATVGRGSEGQQIRDEILHIMHRHNIKEVGGHFLEEWHQKLHNNTTPDDMVICNAFLEFLRSNGNVDIFYKTLEAGGVTRGRLESFERPIRSAPQFMPHLKDGLIGDFQNFLGTLNASHSATDFETALNNTRHQLRDDLPSALDHLWRHRNDSGEPLPALVNRITEVRRKLPSYIESGANARELLYLDLALEQLLRTVVERNLHPRLTGGQLTELIAPVLENLALSHPGAEFSACLRHWERLQSQPSFSVDWSLHASAAAERATRALAGWIDWLYQLCQPKAGYLGHGFRAEDWTIKLFSEEVVRGGSTGFVLSILLHKLDPLLRKAAQMSDWQIISRGDAAGKVAVVDSLRSIQRAHFPTPTVVVTDKIMGDEEIPEGVSAVIAPDVTDVVSHVAVRARNAGILFASCYDAASLQRLKDMKGRFVQLTIGSGGQVNVSVEAAPTPVTAPPAPRPARTALRAKPFERYAVTIEDFNERVAGGKSCNLARLRRQLSDGIGVPASVALPFGVFERVLETDLNRETTARYQQLARQHEADPGEKTLANLRELVLALRAPQELQDKLREAMNSAALPWPQDWETAWTRVKQVWASKWNDRAVLSRKRMGLSHEELRMAVLIQQVVPADYAFVIHTVNPSDGNRDELYAEIVLGLGETLVGNYPGRALRLACNKSSSQQRILGYPSKSVGLYGGGLIFRSDSNGEDLAGYAGAGLYDSVLLEPPAEKTLDYSQERLIWDEGFRRQMFAGILRLGMEIERAVGSPQDIEGAISGERFYVVQTRPQVGIEPAT